MPARFDVAVVGGGPAGCAAAIVLARAGAGVVIVERSAYDGLRIGETLPPESRLVLERLGVWDRFDDDGHMPSPGILAAWGQAEPYANDFILNPYGCGWRVDRNRFDAMLAAGACDAGAVLLTGRTVDRCRRAADGDWELAIDGDGEASAVRAAFVVDAGGRSSSFGRRLGADRVVHDRMVALVRLAQSTIPPPRVAATVDRRALIEATEAGWWYSAWLPDGGLVLSFQTDPAPGLRARWGEFLDRASATARRAGSTEMAGDVRVVSANSHRTEPVAGEGWIAVGDAASAHDPLCGLGIHWALESAIAGAEAILAERSGAAYQQDQYERFERYLATQTDYYRAENRWPESPFWRRRQAPGASQAGRPGVR